MLPRPFDTTLSTNFTSLSCPSFIETFVANVSSCVPLSLLLTTSSAFFQSLNSSTALATTLAASCSVDCSATTSALAQEIRRADRCGADLDQGNVVAVEALTGLQNYPMMRTAGCPSDCFIAAAENPSPADLVSPISSLRDGADGSSTSTTPSLPASRCPTARCPLATTAQGRS